MASKWPPTNTVLPEVATACASPLTSHIASWAPSVARKAPKRPQLPPKAAKTMPLVTVTLRPRVSALHVPGQGTFGTKVVTVVPVSSATAPRNRVPATSVPPGPVCKASNSPATMSLLASFDSDRTLPSRRYDWNAGSTWLPASTESLAIWPLATPPTLVNWPPT